MADENNPQNVRTTGIMRSQGNDPGTMRMRLDTKELLQSIEMFLRGNRIVYGEQDGKIVAKELQFGVPKANEVGIQSILQRLSGIINVHTVQGNFISNGNGISEEYDNYICNVRIDLGDYLWKNIYNFGINESEYLGIIDAIMEIVVPFMTRLIDNEERKSYGDTMKSIETDRTEVRSRGLFGIFK
jgi:hypothetical protein